jgi:zinc-binding alcohol dehydrogenase/oxidoreductase
MRAVRLHEIGGPENLRLDDVPIPQPAPGEALVRVDAAAFNRRDVFITQGLYPGISLPKTLGSDAVGVLEALGNGATCRARAGDAVVIDPMLDWGGDERVWDAKGSSILGMPRDGTFAEYVTVPAGNVYPKPARLSAEEASAIPLAGLTAYRALFARGGLKAGETVLITGIGGGVQTFVLIFAKHAGARAIVTSSSDEKLERAKALGADVTINYATIPDWHKRVRAEGPVNLVVDSSGGDTLAKAVDAVVPGGRIVLYGATRGEATLKLFPLFWKHVSILGTSMGSPQDFAAMLALFDQSDIAPAIDRVYPMRDAVAAAQRMAESNQFGKIVLRIAE